VLHLAAPFLFHSSTAPTPPSLRQARHWLTPAADEEYDLARTPDVCRPFAAAMGDRRLARRCLTDGPADAARTLAALAATPEGAQQLDLLAATISCRQAAASSLSGPF
jgi:hypothetical protein